MKQISKKQNQKNSLVKKARDSKEHICIICKRYCENGDAVHLLPRSTFPQYYTEPLNVWRGHRECHARYDDNKAFRSSLTHIIDIVRKFASEQDINRYFINGYSPLANYTVKQAEIELYESNYPF